MPMNKLESNVYDKVMGLCHKTLGEEFTAQLVACQLVLDGTVDMNSPLDLLELQNFCTEHMTVKKT